MPKFSIIVPVYNVEKFLDECVQSVLRQSFSDWELLLVDDGSKDSSPQMCDKYSASDERILTIHKKNGGASDSRNVGLDHASGEYILFLDSDDFWNNENALAMLNSRLCEKNADCLLFGCTDFNMLTGETRISRNGYDMEIFNKGIKNDALHYLMSNKLIPGGPTIFAVRLSVINDNNIRFKVGVQDEDYDFVLSVYLYSDILDALNEPFYMYRKGRADSVTGSADIKMVYGIEYTINKWLPLVDCIEDEVIKKDFLNYIAFIYSTGFVICGRMNKTDRKKAVRIMNKYRSVLKHSYWKKPIITKYALKFLGANLFSILAAKYFERTHI